MFIFFQIYPLSLSIFFVLFVTLSVFPTVAVHIKSSSTNIEWRGKRSSIYRL